MQTGLSGLRSGQNRGFSGLGGKPGLCDTDGRRKSADERQYLSYFLSSGPENGRNHTLDGFTV